MKKLIGIIGIFIILIIISVSLIVLIKGLTSMKKNNVIYELTLIEKNQKVEIYDDAGENAIDLTYLDSTSNIDGDNVILEYTLLFNHKKDFVIKSDYIDLRSDYGKTPRGNNINFYSTNVEKNIEINTYDIFENPITEDVTYTFSFVIPKTLDDVSYDASPLYVYIFNQYMF